MIRVFGQTDKIFTSNGDIVLIPLKARVHNNDNGEYYLDLETGLDYIDYFIEGNVVVANTPTGDQAFRIGNVIKTKHKLTSKCYHVFYDSENYLIANAEIVDATCSEALTILNTATEPQSEFTVGSDIQTVKSLSIVRKSLYEAVREVTDLFGGHLVRNNFSFSIKNDIGQDNGVIIQYKKNLKDITCQEDWSEVVTKLLPVGKDEILLNAIDPDADIYVTSSIQYDLPYCKTMQFTQDNINQEDYETEDDYKEALVADLLTQATDYVEINCLPKVNYSLKADLDRITDIGDIIEVIDDRLGVHITTKVIGYEYDCIFERYVGVEFGNFSNSLSGLVNSINANASKVASEKAKESKDEILGMMSKSYVTYDGDEIQVLDRLPKEDATNIMTINDEGIGFSHNGGQIATKWSLDGKLTLDGKDVTDFITSEGVQSVWNYRKYASGVIEMWRQVTINSSAVTWSTSIADLNVVSISFLLPFTVTDPVCVATMNDCAGEGWISKAEGSSTTCKISILRELTMGIFHVNIRVIAKESS